MTDQPEPNPDQAAYRAAVVDLLGVLALAELTAFERLAEDAKLAPTLADKAEVAQMAVAEFHHFEQLRRRLAELGIDAEVAMTPFRDALARFHDRTVPNDWYESLVKAYVGDRLAGDFYREIANVLDPVTRDLVVGTVEKGEQAKFIVGRVRAAISEDPRLGGRLALWARRLMGEALTQAQRVVADRDALSALLAGGIDRPSIDLATIGRMFARLTDRHAARMAEVGLDS